MKSVMKMRLPCLVLLGLTLHADAVSVDTFLHKATQDSSGEPNSHDEAPLVKVEKQIEKNHNRLMAEIDMFRAKICFTMHDDFGIKFETFEACHKFMVKTCKPGEDMHMDGEDGEVSSGKGYCTEYFPGAEKKAREKLAKEEPKDLVIAAGPAGGPAGPGPAPGPAAAEAKGAPAPAPKKAAAAPASVSASGPAPAPGPMGVPGPAPVPAPFTPGLTGGKPFGKIAKDESYYYKDGGEDAGRLHMSESLKLPTHGYWGKLVEHEDGETQTDDWGKEFGTTSGHDDLKTVCKKHPESQWCRAKLHKSTAPGLQRLFAVASAIFVAAAF